MLQHVKIINIPMLVSDGTVPIPDFRVHLDQALIQQPVDLLERSPNGYTFVYAAAKTDAERRAKRMRHAFFVDWVTLLLMDPITKQSQSLYPLEFAAEIEVHGKVYAMFPVSTPFDAESNETSSIGFVATYKSKAV
jgi:hypothetical protein